jgi:SAM-dependent methyltransferase
MSESNIPSATSPSEPVLEPGSIRYWKGTDGFSYREMINTREEHGNRAYGQQERFLTTLLQAEQRRLGRPLDVLEFGCGFGRHASYLAGLEGVRYHGYDLSEAMTAPLRQSPPSGVNPVSERLFVGDDPLASVGERRFDLVFSVSVLIHNPSGSIPRILDTLGRLVRPEGLVCLVENQLVPFSVWENGWHQGCWLHAYPEMLEQGWDLHHGPGFIDTHDVYVLKRNGEGLRRFFHLAAPERVREESQPLTREEMLGRAIPKLHQWADRASHALSKDVTSAEARVTELEERLAVETERFQRRHRLLALADDLAGLRQNRVVRPPAREQPPAPAAPQRPAFLFDDPNDTAWAHVDSGFSRVVHVFHQEWHGIRAAAGYSPGHKLAITMERPLTHKEIRQAVNLCSNALARVIIVHGFSPNAHELILAMRKAFDRSVRILCVWHGSTAQLHYEYELDVFRRALALREEGLVDAMGCVKPDMHLVSGDIYPRTLLNLPPRVAPQVRRATGQQSRSAFIPMPNDWRKNFYTNLYACMAAPHIDQVYVTTQFTEPRPMAKPVRRLVRPGRSETFGLMRQVDVVLNASLSECQPMTALESLALRVPCITGPLSLGEFDEHPLQRLCQIARVDVVGPVRDAIERLVDLQVHSPQRLLEMMEDYERRLCAEAILRYQEFIRS